MIGQTRGKPILVTGSNRSGTTWVGRTIALSRSVGYMNEAFNLSFYDYESPHKSHIPIQHRYTYITRDNEAQYLDFVQQTLRFQLDYRIRPTRLPVKLQRFVYATTYRLFRYPRPLLKDPLAAVASEWLAKTFDLDVVVMVRHPAAYVSSLKRLGWGFDFGNFLNQPQLMQDWLQPFSAELQNPPQELVDRGALLWMCLYHVLDGFIQRNPGWTVKQHEEVSAAPVEQFRDIYQRLNIPFTGNIINRIERETSSANPVDAPGNVTHHLQRDSRALVKSWQKSLTEGEITRIRQKTEPLASRFYADDDWI
jgi:hypothetical protein